MAVDVEKMGLKVAINPSHTQDQYGTKFGDAGVLYPLRGRADIPGKGQGEVIFLFEAPTNYPPAHVREQLGGKIVKAKRVVWAPGIKTHLVAPTEESIAVAAEGNPHADKPILPIPTYLWDESLQNLAAGTKKWSDSILERLSLRMILERWDPFSSLDPDKHNNTAANRAAFNRISAVIGQATRTHRLDNGIAISLVQTLASGQEYVGQMVNVRRTDPEAYAVFREASPRQRYQALFDGTQKGEALVTRPLLRAVLDTNPYNLNDWLTSQDDPGLVKEEHDKTLDVLRDLGDRYQLGSPERSIFDRVAINVQLAEQYALWFQGKDKSSSQMIQSMDSLSVRMPFLVRLLRVIEKTNEGQKYSDHLRQLFIRDPQKEVLDLAA